MSRLTFLVVVISLTLTGLVSASEGRSQNPKEISITLTIESALLKDVLAELKKQSGFRFVYAEDVGNIPGVKVSAKSKSLHQVLKEIGLQKDLRFEQSNNLIAVTKTPTPKKKAVKPGIVTGQIIDEDSGEPLIGATIMVKNSALGAVADVEGKYRLSLDPGSYDIEFRFIGYQVKVISGVAIGDGQVTSLNVAMKAEASRLGEVVITSEYSKASVEGLLMKQKNNVSMTDGMSAEQIRATPDNNTAQVLKRVSGVTVQNDRFVTIRGLSDRYNNVLINGASAPSTEPNRRNFAFDIVPSALVDNVVVNKTASPDLPGEFTGGIVMVNTKEIPDKNFVSFTYGRGVNTGAMGKPMISARRDQHAVLGIVDQERKWYGDGRLYDQPKYFSYIAGRDQHKIDSIGSRIPNRWQTYRYPYVPMQNYQLSAGMVKELRHSRVIGFTSALTYRNEQTLESGELGLMFNENYKFTSDRYKYNTSIGALLNTAYKSPRHQLSWKNLYNNRYANQFDDQFGYIFGSSQNQKRTSNVTLASRLIQSRLEGEHSIGKANIRLDWNADITDLQREQPDTRFVAGIYLGGGGQVSDDPDLHVRYNFNDGPPTLGGVFAASLKETKKNAGVNVTVPFQVLRGRQMIKVGYSLSQRKSDYDGTFLKVVGSLPPDLAGLPYYEIVTPESFASGELEYRPSYISGGSTGDRYAGTQELKAYYGMLDLTFLKKFRATGGVRYEDNLMDINTIFYNTAGAGVDSVKAYVDRNLLPSFNLIYSATKKFNIRASYGKTVARPDFVERSPYIYFDFAENLFVTGQQELEISGITNYDFRLEYYFTPGEMVSASVFYKEFSKPVERFFYTGNNSNGVQYRNLHSAEARGIEVNFIKSLNFSGLPDHWTSGLYLSGNFTVLEGSIKAFITRTAGGQDTLYVSSYNRPVQGLSPYTINGGLAYQAFRWGINVNYNKFGRRIVNGGAGPRHVQYEVPRDVIDVQLNWHMLQKKLTARVNISDLLNQPFVIYANNSQHEDKPNDDPKGDEYNPAYDYVTYNAKRGTNYSFSLTYTF